MKSKIKRAKNSCFFARFVLLLPMLTILFCFRHVMGERVAFANLLYWGVGEIAANYTRFHWCIKPVSVFPHGAIIKFDSFITEKFMEDKPLMSC